MYMTATATPTESPPVTTKPPRPPPDHPHLLAVPVSSYSLKDVETVAGYERQLEETSGGWSMAKYIEATESEDREERDALIGEIRDYNREDLEASLYIVVGVVVAFGLLEIDEEDVALSLGYPEDAALGDLRLTPVANPRAATTSWRL